MARKSAPASPQARQLVLAIRQGERQGLTQKQIAAALGINERTVRKAKSGQTSGTRTVERLTKTPRAKRAETGLFNAEYVIGYDDSGQAVIGSSNVTIPAIRNANGTTRPPTALDVFRVRGLARLAAEQRAAQARRYGAVTRVAGDDTPIRLRAISSARRRVTVLRTAAL